MEYLVTGTGRCGTLFMANLLTSMGLPCSHEAVFTPRGLAWAEDVSEGRAPRDNSRVSEGKRCLPRPGDPYVAESSYMAAPFLGKVEAKIIHVVRDPFKVVGSLVGQSFRQFSASRPTHLEDDPEHLDYERFIYDQLPDLGRDMDQLDRGCLFYVLWNEMIEASGRVDLFHRIEDGPERIRDFVGFKGESYYRNSKCNSFGFKRSWLISDVKDHGIRKKITNMAERYGYFV